ncbi:MAG: hypothetical protein PQJ60_14470 [Spirochaetales bacterium]|nr:hypothetical protein [Spirochaetales bacterium]
MEKKQVLDTIHEINRLLEDFFFKPVISTAMERYEVNNGKEIRYFIQDVSTYVDDKPFMADGVAELVSFKNGVKENVLPQIDEALMISPFHKSRHNMSEEELLYRRMMSHIFKDNVEMLHGLVEKLKKVFPDGSLRHGIVPESKREYKNLLVRA